MDESCYCSSFGLQIDRFVPILQIWTNGSVAASTSVSLLLSITGRDGCSAGNASYSDFLSHIASVRSFGLGTGMKRPNAKLVLMYGSSRTVRMFPIARLYGFALSTGEAVRDHTFLLNIRRLILTLQFTRIEYLPFLRRRLLQWLRLPVPSYYVPHLNTINSRLDGVSEAGYLLMECIEETHGTMLSNTWSEKQHDVELRTNFFRGLSQILLSISRTPLPHIGFFNIDKDGYLTLCNLPLSMRLQELENERIPTGLPRDYTYSTVEFYIRHLSGP